MLEADTVNELVLFMPLSKRAFLSGAGAVFGLCVARNANGGEAVRAEVRIGQAALRTLPPDTIQSLAREAPVQRGDTASTLQDRMAADYRAGRTYTIERVRLSRTEVIHALDSVLSA